MQPCRQFRILVALFFALPFSTLTVYAQENPDQPPAGGGSSLFLPWLGAGPVALAVDDDRVADGFYIEIAEPLLNTAALHAVDAVETTVTVRISTSDTLDPGSYVAPLVASSGQLRHLINLPVEVLAGGAVAPAGLYLPLVAR